MFPLLLWGIIVLPVEVVGLANVIAVPCAMMIYFKFLRNEDPVKSRIIRYFEKKKGISYERINELYQEVKEQERLDKEREKVRAQKLELLYRERAMFPLMQQICKLNVGGRKEQEAFLTERYSEEAIPFIFDTEYSEEQKQASFQYWVKQDLQKRRKMVELLFKLTVLQDGIRNNEWNLLMQIMTQLKFNNYYIDYFKKRYAPLRTEFDEYQRSGTSSANYSASYLKPYYAVLGLQEGASDDEIKRAYHELAMQHHPDRPHNAGCIKECEAMMAKLNEAYEKVMG